MTCPARSEVYHQFFLFINSCEYIHAVLHKKNFHCGVTDTFVSVYKWVIFNQ